jgi:hypothetical protein
MMEALSSSETSVLIRATLSIIPEDAILLIYETSFSELYPVPYSNRILLPPEATKTKKKRVSL